jgi:hypothetical protein
MRGAAPGPTLEKTAKLLSGGLKTGRLGAVGQREDVGILLAGAELLMSLGQGVS